jgi:GTP pyrophosphokinase
MARESQLIYAPLANRLGIWQVKWELEDLSFRYLEPETYKRIARMLDEKRSEREGFIEPRCAACRRRWPPPGFGRGLWPAQAHLQHLEQDARQGHRLRQVYDVRAVRIIVDEVKDCYTALGIVHHLWQPIHGEFDDYISHPKGNFYRSLHTAVEGEDGRSLEVQIRTREMHEHAELGVAAHWRYKESGKSAKAGGAYEDKISWLRQLLSWRDEIADSAEWVQQFKRAALDDTIYVLTPQDKVIDLPRGATPLDFAYRLHTDLGHRCRGAKVDGHMVSLNTPLAERPARGDCQHQERRSVARLAESGAGLPRDTSRARVQGQAMVRRPGRGGACWRRGAASSRASCSAKGRPRPASTNWPPSSA